MGKSVGDIAAEIMGEGISPIAQDSSDPSIPNLSNEAFLRKGINIESAVQNLITETTSCGSLGVNMAGAPSIKKKRKRKKNILTLKVR